MRALIVEGAHSRGALAATRALGKAGWTVGVGSAPHRRLAAFSRWATYKHVVPPPESDRDRFVSAVSRAVRERGYDVVFGSGDAEMLALSEARDELGASLGYPPHEAVVRALDKLELAAAAERAGLRCPRTVEATDEALETMPEPFLIKVRRHAPPGRDHGTARYEAVVPSDRDTAFREVASIRSRGGAPLLQELVQGSLVAYAAVLAPGGRVLASLQQRAEAIWPARAGGSVRAVSVSIDQDLARQAGELLAELGWFGLAQLQFIERDRGDRFLIDLNGRFYGSLALARGAGACLASAWASSALGQAPEGSTVGRPGVRYQSLELDLRRALSERREGLLADTAGCIRYSFGAVHSVASREDPWPAVRHGAHLARRLVGKLVAR